jgi:hypothetical protein
LPDNPQAATWLTPSEKAIISFRVHDQQESHLSSSSSSSSPSISHELTFKNFANLLKLYISEMKNTFKYPKKKKREMRE